MPYIPRQQPGRFAPTSLPDTMPGVVPPRDDKPPMPPVTPTAPTRKTAAKNPMLSMVSVRRHEVPVEKVFEQLFGKPSEVDPVSGLNKSLQPSLPKLAHPALAKATDVNEVFKRLFPAQKV
jgi:hypothetical protein